ncbi:MAG: adenylyltransferase/cytidyltransferase family protein [Tepidisphaeraceae bacterium]
MLGVAARGVEALSDWRASAMLGRVSSQKIFANPHDLLPLVNALRAAGKTLVFGNGCFDIIHVGHVRYLRAAKALGDVLIIAVNTDESVRMGRPDRMPINPDHERMEVIAALAPVDYVVPLADRLPNALLELFQPHVQAKGTDYTLALMPERVVVEAYGGRIEFVGDEKGHSSSELRAALESRQKR